ncbi:MAG: LemA family protein [Desulfobacterales bacterium]|jgi:LemA protein|nr:LemA family protein [Desulfobacterales bacterium]
MVSGILAALAAILIGYAISIYNRLVRLRNTSQSAWSDIDVQVKKRYDLVPNLVETVKGYAGHERGLLERLTEARGAGMKASGPAQTAQAENMFRDTLKSLFAVAEAYPDLKANQNFMQLQAQLKDLEDGIESARRYYNAVVRDFNTAVEQFPSNLIASRFQFGKRDFFELETPHAERKPVPVNF